MKKISLAPKKFQGKLISELNRVKFFLLSEVNYINLLENQFWWNFLEDAEKWTENRLKNFVFGTWLVGFGPGPRTAKHVSLDLARPKRKKKSKIRRAKFARLHQKSPFEVFALSHSKLIYSKLMYFFHFIIYQKYHVIRTESKMSLHLLWNFLQIWE